MIIAPIAAQRQALLTERLPLACGGPDCAANLQWQTTAAANAKDRWERKACAANRA
jgi:hypothetical protein